MADPNLAEIHQLMKVKAHIEAAFELATHALLEGITIDPGETMWVELAESLEVPRDRATGRVDRLINSAWES